LLEKKDRTGARGISLVHGRSAQERGLGKKRGGEGKENKKEPHLGRN